jgi:hypothetical protein
MHTLESFNLSTLEATMNEAEVLALIYSAMRKCKHPAINDVSLDGDAKSGEVIITTDDGECKQVWVLRLEEADASQL